MQQVSPSIATVFLDQPPSCLEFCPADPDYFVVGTYLLSETDGAEKAVREKTGSLQLWKLDNVTHRLTKTHRIELPHAVFDLHFHPRERTLLAVATSSASVSLYRVAKADNNLSSFPYNSLNDETHNEHNKKNGDEHALVIQHLWTIPVHEAPTTPSLHLAWAPERWFLTDKITDGFAVTFSDGRTSIFSTRRPLNEAKFTTHVSFESPDRIEVWFAAFTTMHIQEEKEGNAAPREGPPRRGSKVVIPFLFTGNDFGVLHIRQYIPVVDALSHSPDDDEDRTSSDEGDPIVVSPDDCGDKARHHTAGVTVILPLPIPISTSIHAAPILLTGSYDEFVRVYHATRTGKVLAEMKLDGGVWRLQLIGTGERGREGLGESEHYNPDSEGTHHTSRFFILASCMHAGARILRVTCRRNTRSLLLESMAYGDWDIKISAAFTEHRSMNYASDVWGGGTIDDGEPSEILCVSSSFYDRRMCLWKATI